VKLAHLADLHLGFRQFDRQTARGGNQREADVADAFRRAVDDILEQRPDLIVVAGDVFHSVRPTNPAILFLFQQVQRLRVGLPDAPIVLVAGTHDTPRSSETGTILKLYEALGVEVVVDAPRRLVFPTLDCAVLAAPHQALAAGERPALRPERGATLNVLVAHCDVDQVVSRPDRTPLAFGGAQLAKQELAPAQWDYIALGHYHIAHQVAANAWYSGSLDYVTTTPWLELQYEEEEKRRGKGKGYLLVELPGARVSFRQIAPVRRLLDLPPVHGEGLTAKEVDTLIAERVSKAKPSIDDQIARLVVWDVSRATQRDLDHAALRSYKSRALNFLLDVRRPAPQRVEASGAPGRRLTLPETVREFLTHRPLDADLDRADFVQLGVEYVTQAEAGAED
jgi:DNA repair protein SbcD/Mre11